ncbi:adenosylcobinamide-GDP ribazoletransferase [Methanobrevibacter filiformis]|uniref:Adenosylcobinamide-GDP ribazoletransferase n=1 Tax=Methanobrevibacter filiformis TaxID=55758 RepID=A0A162F9J3_9EURY|nr:adenosylcobinamide-GDP ribazoletransferase [Methanobrevibacter filiformis]KZX09885.1 cobalamin synthase [Methanobrevibacter filiformis]
MEKDKKKDDYFKEKSSILSSITGLITFSTILPLNFHTRIEDMAKFTWFWPFISGGVGIIGLIISYFTIEILKLSPLLSAILIYSFYLLFNGFHHLDGLMDFGDAVMAHGSPERKIAIMRDPMIGTGAVALLIIVGFISIGAIDSILTLKLFGAILIGEISGKIGLITCALSSKPGVDGTGKFFIENMSVFKYLIAILITAIISYLILSYAGVFGILGGMLGGGIVAYISKKQFKIATGDVLGASNEIGRMISFVLMIIAINLI